MQSPISLVKGLLIAELFLTTGVIIARGQQTPAITEPAVGLMQAAPARLSPATALPSPMPLSFSSLSDMLLYADKNSLVSRKSALQRTISRKDELINRSATLPRINLFGTAEYDPLIPSLVVPGSLVGGNGTKYQRVTLGLPWNFTSGAEITLPVINFEKWEQLRRYRLQSRQTDWNTEVSRESLHIQLTQYYYQALVYRELLGLNQSDLQVADELMRIQDNKKSNHLLDPADYNRSRNLQLDIRTAGVEYEASYRQSLIALQQLLHLPDSTALQITDSLESADWTAILQPAGIGGRPAWKEAETKVDVAQLQWEEARRAALPVISLDGKYTYEWQAQFSPAQHINYDFSSIGLRLDFPLFQGYYYTTSRQRAALQLDLTRASRDQTADSLTRQQSEWWNSFQAAIKKRSILSEKLETTADNLRIARLSMKEGVMEFEEFNNIFQEYNKARMDYLQNANDGIIYRIFLTQKW